MILDYKITGSGICATPCPHVQGVMIGSMACETCKCFFGLKNGGVRCNGHIIFAEDGSNGISGVFKKKSS
jgi:hypothetical protein